MIISNRQSVKKKQSGIALLVVVIALFLTISTYYFSSISMVDIQADKVEKTQAELKRAKQALLDYALVNWNLNNNGGKIGKLPCPDYRDDGTEGEQDVNCGKAYANGIGYFPWRTLGIENTKDSSGSCLLYAVSPAYKTGPAAALNPDSYGQFKIVSSAGVTIQGGVPEDRPVAVIIAPGQTLVGQLRESDPAITCGSYYGNVVPDLIAAYLDDNGGTDNAAIDPDATNNNIENLVSKYAGSDEGNNPLNDTVVTITHKEFWDVMQDTITSAAFNERMKNLTEALALCFAGYGERNNKHLPMPAPLNLDGGEYRRNIDYNDSGTFTTGFAGRLPYDVGRANNQLPPAVPVNEDHIFKNNFCNSLTLDATPGSGLDNINFSDDTGSDNGEFFDLWQNWKDHFFYAVSRAHNPGVAVDACVGNCVSINGIEYAGIVFYSGLKQGTQRRYAPPLEAVDDKSNMANYLENGNAALFLIGAGNAAYSTSASNDIMFCINTDMSVVQC